MKTLLTLSLAALALPPLLAADPALTIYNQDFAVVRDTIPLDLQAGTNQVSVQNITSQLEPDSVILRDPRGKIPLQILEQNYRNDPVTQSLLLSLNEGRTMDFVVHEPNKPDHVVTAKIIRSGYTPPQPVRRDPYGNPIYMPPQAPTEPIIETGGKLQFSLPGQPLFPSLGDDTILKPRLSWTLNAPQPAKLEAELCYITGGMTWKADYNVVAPENNDTLDIVGWVTMTNRSGKTFENAKIKLMAGEVNKLQPERSDRVGFAVAAAKSMTAPAPAATEKTFDEYHLYTLVRPATLHDQETKQVEFIRTSGVKSQRIHVYDGLRVDWNRWRGYDLGNLRRNEEFGSESDSKIAVMREFKNTEANHLGMPLPAGRLRFYQQDDDGQLEFIGENEIGHTPRDETVRVFTGNAFDLVGERRRTDFKISNANDWCEEAIEIKLRNRKKEPVEIRVVEHLYRWTNWEITENSSPFEKLNSQEIEFRIPVKPGEEKTLTYRVHYSW